MRSRLRRAVKAYDENSNELLDSSVQDDIVLELKASLQRSGEKVPSLFVHAVMIGVVLMNMILLTVPYYKKTPVISLMVVLSSLVDYLVLRYDKYPIAIPRLALLTVSLMMSLLILWTKLNTFGMLDLLYCVPLLLVCGLYVFVTDDDGLDEQIKLLEKLKYDHKEA